MSGRMSKEAIKIGFDVEEFQIWPAVHPFTKLFLKHLHEKYGHCSADRILHFARCSGVWIANGMKTCRVIRNTCMLCRLRDKKRTEQLMCNVKEFRTTPSPVFQTTSLDLWGPLYIRDNIVRKKTRSHTVHKCWGIIYCCLSTGSVTLDLTEDYSTDSVLASIRRFISVRGQPSRFICDQGSQLKAAAKKSKEMRKLFLRIGRRSLLDCLLLNGSSRQSKVTGIMVYQNHLLGKHSVTWK